MDRTPQPSIEGHRSAFELLDHHDCMSIPHFQRGLVWDTHSVALLLESLYHGTPCGSIILWTPSDVSPHGTPLGEAASRYLIIDGQQRIRSLHAVFRNIDDESATSLGDPDAREQDEQDEQLDADAHDDGEGEEEEGLWCLNLGRLPELADEFPGGKRFRLFRRVKDPRAFTAPGVNRVAGAPLQDREALLPLNWFLESLADEPATLQHIAGPGRAISKAVLAALRTASVRSRLELLLTRPTFHVSILKTDDLAQVVGVFTRINSAGKRVEREETAFANLVAQRHDADAWLQRFFADVHGRQPTSGRDDRLRRENENRFGFKLFMRVFVLVLAYHSDRRVGSSTFSFDAANVEALTKAKHHLDAVLDSTVSVLQHAATLLREPPLFCDDFRMLPETASLWPLFQLLVRFPGLMPDSKGALARATLRLLLADLSKQDLPDLCNSIGNARSVKDVLDLFEHHPALRSDAIEAAIRQGVTAQSLTSRYTLLLYWLLRRARAKDFSYDENIPETAAVLRKRYGCDAEASLGVEVAPQKQHIVPYSRLKDMFGLVGARPGRHEVHDVGNLTYISAGLNSFKTGLGRHAISLGAEPPENRNAHMLLEPELLSEYDDAISDSTTAKASYRRFCERRRQLIVDRLLAWEQDTRGLSLHAAAATVVTTPRLLDPRPEDILRALGYPQAVTTVLLSLCDDGRGRMESKASRVTIVCKAKTAGGRTRQQFRVGLDRHGTRLELRVPDRGLASRFRRHFPQVGPEPKPRLKAVFTKNGQDRLRIVCHGIGDRYTIKEVHKAVSNDGRVDRQVSVIARSASHDTAVRQFDEHVTDALEKGWLRKGKGRAFRCQIDDPELMAAVVTWLESQLRAGGEGTS